MTEEYDSIRAAERVARSQRLRTVLVALWPYFLAVGSAAGTWIAKSMQTEEHFATLRADIRELRQEVTALRGGIERQDKRVLAIGRQAAYASAAGVAGETTPVKRVKLRDARKFAAEFDRLTGVEQRDPETAYLWLFPHDPTP